jgi:hypothetical protein
MKSYQSANERGELMLDHVIITFCFTLLRAAPLAGTSQSDNKDNPRGKYD